MLQWQASTKNTRAWRELNFLSERRAYREHKVRPQNKMPGMSEKMFA